LLGLAEIGGDLDGGLLVTDESQLFSGGFEWTIAGVKWPAGCIGSGVQRKEQQ